MTTKAEQILSNQHGEGVTALALSSIAWHINGDITRHPSLKKPKTVLGNYTNELQDILSLPETPQDDPIPLDTLVNQAIACIVLIRNLAYANEQYKYLTQTKTPTQAVISLFDWKGEQAGKLARTQAELVGLTAEEAQTVASKAKARADADNKSNLEYALDMLTSATNPSLLNQNAEEAVETLLDSNLDIEKITKEAVANSIERTKQRLLAGLYAVVDAEVALYK
jgi:hypothetical protein